MKRQSKAVVLVVGIVGVSLLVFSLAPVVKTGQSCGGSCITSTKGNGASNAIYSSVSCATLGFGDSLWKGSIYMTCNPPIPVTD